MLNLTRDIELLRSARKDTGWGMAVHIALDSDSGYGALQKQATQEKRELFETPLSYSYRVFENRQTRIIHIFYKP